MNQKLAALHTRAGRFAEAAVCMRTLESIYRDAGHADEASRYGELASKYEERSGSSATKSHEVVAPSHGVAEFEVSAPVHEPEAETAKAVVEAPEQPKSVTTPSGLFFHGAAPVTAAPASAEVSESAPAPGQEAAAEIDLSSEWEQDFSVEALPSVEDPVPDAVVAPVPETAVPAETDAAPEVEAPSDEIAPTPGLDESIEEVRFYLGQGLTEQADELLAKLEKFSPGAPELAVLRLGIDSAKQIASAQPEPEIEVTPEQASTIEEAPALPVPTRQPWPSERPVLQEMVSEIEASLGDSFLDQTPAVEQTPVSNFAEPVVEPVIAAQQFRSGTLEDFVSDLEASLGSDFAVEPQAAAAQAPTPAPGPALASV